MPVIRTEQGLQRASYTSISDITIDTYDVGLCWSTNGTLRKANAEIPNFIATSNASASGKVSTVTVDRAFRCALKVAGTVSAGQHITTDSSGNFVASGTAETAAITTGEIGVFLENGVAGDLVECAIQRGI